MPKTWYAIKAATSEGDDAVDEVDIFDEIGFWGINARQFLTDLRATKAPTIRVNINSPGGDVMDGVAIFNGLRAMASKGRKIEARVMGIAASAASYIAMAADTIEMPENTFMWVHNPVTGVYGDADDFKAVAEELDRIGESFRAIYAKRYKGDAAAMNAMFADETLLTAQQCLEIGFADTVTEAISVKARFEARAVDAMPAQVRAALEKFQARPPEPAPAPVGELDVAAITALATEHGHPDLAAYLATMDRPTREAVTARLVEAKQIFETAKAAGYDEAKAARMVRGGKSVVEARKTINAYLIEQDEKTAVDTTPPAPTGPKPSAAIQPIPTWDEIRALQAKSYGKTPATT